MYAVVRLAKSVLRSSFVVACRTRRALALPATHTAAFLGCKPKTAFPVCLKWLTTLGGTCSHTECQSFGVSQCEYVGALVCTDSIVGVMMWKCKEVYAVEYWLNIV